MKSKLKELGHSKSNEVASPGRFRACVMLDSCTYQIGEDTADINEAEKLVREYWSEMQPVQIFNDKGESLIVNGKIQKEISIPSEDEHDGDGPWHRNEPPV